MLTLLWVNGKRIVIFTIGQFFMSNLIKEAFEIAGFQRLADECGVSEGAPYKWLRSGRLPRTELTGETDHASAIERATAGAVSAEALREMTRQAWRNNKRQAA